MAREINWTGEPVCLYPLGLEEAFNDAPFSPESGRRRSCLARPAPFPTKHKPRRFVRQGIQKFAPEATRPRARLPGCHASLPPSNETLRGVHDGLPRALSLGWLKTEFTAERAVAKRWMSNARCRPRAPLCRIWTLDLVRLLLGRL
ncbi:hypothetical protein Fmac_028181 [Flemingia macrophylla]|uniref:Uncharacterized protein n=1 Tax=Flemingia macrophylla TaxID=520843 RepID=A0ABD1L6S0_9FABA